MDNAKRFDVPQVLAALKAAVEKRGEDYVYVNADGVKAGTTELSCEYTHHAGTDAATPGCIVGQVYFDLTGELVPEYQNASTISEFFTSPREVFTDAAAGLLLVAQRRQDDGATWGEALAAARKAAEK